MYLKSPPKCFYGGEGIKNDRLVTYKIQYIHEEIAIIIPTDTKKTQDEWFSKKKPLN